MWPDIPNVVSLSPKRLLTTSTLADPVREKLIQWKNNKTFLQFISQVERLLVPQSGPETKQSEYQPILLLPLPRKPSLQCQTLSSILRAHSSPHISVQDDSQRGSGDTASAISVRPQKLSNLLTRLSSVPLRPDSLPHRYLENLAQSIHSFEVSTLPEFRRCPSEDELNAILSVALEHHSLCRDAVLDEFAPFTTKDALLQLAGMLPPISTHILLRQLSQHHRGELPVEWRSTLISYAIVVQNAQRAIRMLQHLIYDRKAHLIADFHHQRHWNAENYLDWLLVEIDGNFSIRENQADIASCMMHPDEHGTKNTVMQLNMGEGKSSVCEPSLLTSVSLTPSR